MKNQEQALQPDQARILSPFHHGETKPPVVVRIDIPPLDVAYRTLRRLDLDIPPGSIVIIRGAVEIPYRFAQMIADCIANSAAGVVAIHLYPECRFASVVWSSRPDYSPGSAIPIPDNRTT